MNPAMNIGVVVFVVMNKRINYRARLLRSGRIIQINQGVPVNLLMQDREVRSNLLELRRRKWSALVHEPTYINPNCNRAASLIMLWFQIGSQTTSTFTSVTPGTPRTR